MNSLTYENLQTNSVQQSELVIAEKIYHLFSFSFESYCSHKLYFIDKSRFSYLLDDVKLKDENISNAKRKLIDALGNPVELTR